MNILKKDGYMICQKTSSFITNAYLSIGGFIIHSLIGLSIDQNFYS